MVPSRGLRVKLSDATARVAWDGGHTDGDGVGIAIVQAPLQGGFARQA